MRSNIMPNRLAGVFVLFLVLLGLSSCGASGAPAGGIISALATPVPGTDAAETPARAPATFPDTASSVPLERTITDIPKATKTRVDPVDDSIFEEMAKERVKYPGKDRTTNVAQAQAQLFLEGLDFSVIIVSPQSTGVQKQIYDDLIKRNFRATAGPDEGFDTKEVDCYPNCVFVRYQAVNQISVESWKNVLRHEQRHMVQASHNRNLAHEFRSTPTNMFTTYAAFMEACADDGIYVGEPSYHASERMPRLKNNLGIANTTLLTRACEGYPDAYIKTVDAYDAKAGKGAFAKLFPPYK